jgi:uncharacterized protein DUF4838/glycosyl hydrolase family 67
MILPFLIAVIAAPADDFVLVRDGRPEAEILLGDREPAAPVLFAAEELRRYVQAMSGAALPTVRTGTAERTIVISTGRDAPARDLGSPPSSVAEDHYLIEVSERRISILGGSPRASLYAVYDLLERLGCGWCVPGDDTVPKKSTLTIPVLKIDTVPAFPYRMMLDFPLQSVAQSIAIVDWISKNRLNWVHPCPNAKGEPTAWYERRDRVVPEIKKRGLHLIFGGHTMHTWLPPEEFKDHPDWFALNDGERKPPTLCVSNEAMTVKLIENLRRFLERCPEVDVVDLWHPDGDVYCHCTVCTQGLVPAEASGKKPDGTPADAVQSAYLIRYIEFMNRVAAAIARSHPRVLISPLIYGPADHAMPDGCPAPADNLLLGLAHISRDSYRPLAGEPASALNRRFLGNDLTWMARSKHHFIYEYYNAWVAPFIYPGAQVIVRDLQILREIGSQGASSDMYGYSPCNMYVGARALWSPDISWEAAVRDFHLRYYGQAGPSMADNWVALEKAAFGKTGYQSGGALNEPALQATSGTLFIEVRPRQIELLEGLIGRTEDPPVKARLERALKPWKLWSNDARWWAFPPFEDKKETPLHGDASAPK